MVQKFYRKIISQTILLQHAYPIFVELDVTPTSVFILFDLTNLVKNFTYDKSTYIFLQMYAIVFFINNTLYKLTILIRYFFQHVEIFTKSCL